MYFIETHEVGKQYSGHTALDKVSIRVPEGQIFGLLGPNGAGKTTLIRILNRILTPDTGTVSWQGRTFRQDDVARIGYLPEERGLYPRMKVGEQAVYLARLKGLSSAEAHRRLKILFEKFDIVPWWNKRLEELSKGMQQKIQFIVTVVHEPDLIIFDEPFSGFDPVNADLMKKELLQLRKQGKTIIFSTHNMPSVEELCDEIALINHSKVVLNGTVNDVRFRYKSNVIFLKTAGETPVDACPELFRIIEQQTVRDIHTARLQKNPDVTNATLIRHLSSRYNILVFEEEIPSMNDIFILTVSSHEQ
jgi:ABC-2 type transport system ATP-binding protein